MGRSSRGGEAGSSVKPLTERVPRLIATPAVAVVAGQTVSGYALGNPISDKFSRLPIGLLTEKWQTGVTCGKWEADRWYGRVSRAAKDVLAGKVARILRLVGLRAGKNSREAKERQARQGLSIMRGSARRESGSSPADGALRVDRSPPTGMMEMGG